jgi:hypothetical protein
VPCKYEKSGKSASYSNDYDEDDDDNNNNNATAKKH